MSIFRKFIYKKLSVLLLVISLFAFPVVASSTSVSLSPSSASVAIGSQFTVTVNISNAANLFGVAFDLIYDPAKIQFVSAQKGSFLEQGGATTVMTTAVSPVGDLIVGYSRQAVGGVATGIDGSGTLMSITFRGLASGTSSLVFQNNALCDPNGSSCHVISADWSNGSTNITAAASSSSSSSSHHHKKKKKKKSTSGSRSISQSKNSVVNGQILTERGKKFSKNSLVRLYFSKFGGGYYAPTVLKTSASGAFSIQYRVNKPKGSYTWYAIDVTTGKKSKVKTYRVK